MITLFSCSENDNFPNEKLQNSGRINIYTNAQALLNCGVFDVDIYIDSTFIGNISEAYVDSNLPESDTSTSYLLVSELTAEKHDIFASMNCGQYGYWKKEILVAPNVSNYLFLDINECEIQKAKKGKVVFYTNAQALLNCGPFDVDIYIDSVYVGKLNNAFVGDIQPDCTQKETTLIVEKKIGIYNFYAIPQCGDYNNWTGQLEIVNDNCIYIYLNINNLTKKQ